MPAAHPTIVLLAGPNGAGKSTAAPYLLPAALSVTEFVNADAIARGLSAFAPETVAIAAGRIMLDRARQLAAERKDFALETTLAARSLAPWIRSLASAGYSCRIVFLWLPSADAAIARVASRVRAGGHDVPADVIRRRYQAELRNFFGVYRPLADIWEMMDATSPKPWLIAAGSKNTLRSCTDTALWARMEAEHG